MLSDDSHGVAQVGLNYHRMFEYMHDLGIKQYHHVEVNDGVVYICEHTFTLAKFNRIGT